MCGGSARCDSDLTHEALDPEARGEFGMEHFDGDRSLVFQVCRQKTVAILRGRPRGLSSSVCEAGLQTSEEASGALLGHD